MSERGPLLFIVIWSLLFFLSWSQDEVNRSCCLTLLRIVLGNKCEKSRCRNTNVYVRRPVVIGRRNMAYEAYIP